MAASTSRFKFEINIAEKKSKLVNKNTKKATLLACNLFRDYLRAANLPCGIEFESFEPAVLNERLAEFFFQSEDCRWPAV